MCFLLSRKLAPPAALPQAFPLLFTSEGKRHRFAEDAEEDDAERRKRSARKLKKANHANVAP